MTGNYVHFGVLELYNDNCFVVLSRMAFQRILALNMEELPKYKSAEKTVYTYIQEFLKFHSELALLNYECKTVMIIVNLTKLGLGTESSEIITSCCSALDEFLLFIVRERFKSKQKLALQQAITLFLNEATPLLLEINETLFRMACFEEGDYMYAVANPLFTLMLLNKALFEQVKGPVLESEKSASARERLFEELQKLFEGVTFSLEGGDRNKFLSNFTKFKASIRGIV